MSALKDWYAAAELEALKLPGLPGSGHAIRAKAVREGWTFKLVQSRGRKGGRREYARASLPAEAQAALAGLPRGGVVAELDAEVVALEAAVERARGVLKAAERELTRLQRRRRALK